MDDLTTQLGFASLRLLEASTGAVLTADRFASRCFLYRRAKGAVLDTLLGAEEPFEVPEN